MQLSGNERLVLNTLTSGAAHGHQIVGVIGGVPANRVGLARTVYTSLHRLEKRGLVAAEWKPCDTKRCARYYRLTRRGWRGLSDGESVAPAPRLVAAVVTLFVIGTAQADAAGARRSHRRVAVVVTSTDTITVRELRSAGLEVERILGMIGVDVEWLVVDESTHRETPRQPRSTFAVRVSSISTPYGRSAVRSPLGVTLEATCSGAAMLLFEQNIHEFAGVHRLSPALVFGLVIAHEIGHSLLPPPGHTTRGIMQTPWDHDTMQQAAAAGLTFTSEQGASIRSRLDGCASSMQAQ